MPIIAPPRVDYDMVLHATMALTRTIQDAEDTLHSTRDSEIRKLSN